MTNRERWDRLERETQSDHEAGITCLPSSVSLAMRTRRHVSNSKERDQCQWEEDSYIARRSRPESGPAILIHSPHHCFIALQSYASRANTVDTGASMRSMTQRPIRFIGISPLHLHISSWSVRSLLDMILSCTRSICAWLLTI